MSNIFRRIKNWTMFQNYQSGKNAVNPKWIKLYRNLLDDIQWHKLAGDDAKTLVSLWLLASENGGALPPIEIIAFRLRMTEKAIKSILDRLPHWLETCPSDVLGQSQDSPRLEEEEEEEEEKEGDKLLTADAVAFEAYNQTARELGLPLANKLDKSRRKKLRAILAENHLQGWKEALASMQTQSFLLGENQRGWRADLDFLLQPKSFRRVLEGSYGGKPQLNRLQEAGLKHLQEIDNAASRRTDSGPNSTCRVIEFHAATARPDDDAAPADSPVNRPPDLASREDG